MTHYGSYSTNTGVGEENRYRYNGKEFNEELGLYAYGARYYDPTIGRFTGVDPIADQFPHVSTHNYAENEPIGNIDLHGLQKVSIHVLGTISVNIASQSQTQKTDFAAALLVDQGNNNLTRLAVGVDGLAIGGAYDQNSGVVDLQAENKEGFYGDVRDEIIASKQDGWHIPGYMADGYLEDAADGVRSQISDENSDLTNTGLEIGAKILEMIAVDVGETNAHVRYSRDGSVDVATRADGSKYKRKMTNSFTISPEGTFSLEINGVVFEGQVSVRYTQEKCRDGCE